jgi:hypothetical protein
MTNEEFSNILKAEFGKLIAKLVAILVEVKRLSLDASHIPGHEHSEGNPKHHKTDNRPDKPQADFVRLPAIPEHTPTISAPDERSSAYNKICKWLRNTRNVLHRWKIVIEWAGAAVLLAYTIITYCTLQAIKESNRITTESLRISQRAYITLGRKDGVVAEFLKPSDPNSASAIVVYFQNSGHLPAHINWGATPETDLMAKMPETSPFFGIASYHHFTPIQRIRGRQNNVLGYDFGIGTVIGSDSLYVADFGTLPSSKLSSLAHNIKTVEIDGAFESCDDFGTYVCRQFVLKYRPLPYDSFTEINERDCLPFITEIKKRSEFIYLKPCPSPADREEESRKYGIPIAGVAVH